MGKASRKKKSASEVSVSQHSESGHAAATDGALLHYRIIHLFLIVVIGFIAYSNTFHASFHFDDAYFIVNNPAIKDIGFFIDPSKAEELNGSLRYNLKNRYVGFLTFALNYGINGLDVAGYHAFNLAVHLTNAILLYLFVVMSFSTPFLKRSSPKSRSGLIALFVALFFVCHPVQTQAVTYIWQRVTSIATMFYLLSLVLYLKWRTSGQRSATPLFLYIASVVSSVLAMKTKEIAFTLPVVLTLYEFMFFEGRVKKRILYLVPFLITMCIIPLALLKIDRPVGEIISEVGEAARAQTNMSRTDYMFTQWRVIVTYIRLLFFPAHQTFDYDYPTYHAFFEPEVFLPALFLTSIACVAIYIFCRYRKTVPQIRLVSFGIFWFFITLSVESSIIPIEDMILEHRVYLPSVGAFIAVTMSLFAVKDKLAQKGMRIWKAIVPALALAVIVLAGATYMRNIAWQNEVNLWSDVVEKSPFKARGHNNLGTAYKDRGWIDGAVEQYEIASKLKPDYAEAHNNLGNAYTIKGWTDKAIEQYEIALKLRPNLAEAHNNLGFAYNNKGWTDKAVEQFEIALKLKPNVAGTHYNLGNAYTLKGWTDKAIEQYEIALKLKPNLVGAHYNLGNAYKKKGLKVEAEREFREALRIRPDFAQAHQALESLIK